MSSDPIERSLSSSSITEIFGTIDVLILDESKKHIDALDYKFGRNRVDHASENIQGHAYMVGTFDRFAWAETVTVHFVTPRLDEVTKHTYNREDLEWHRLRVKVVVDRATEEEPELNPRTESCRFCKNRVSCKALHDQLLPLAKKYDNNNFAIDLLKKHSPSAVQDPAILGKMLEVAPVMEAWAKAAKAAALELATETGEQIPGYEVRYRNPKAKVDNPQKAFEAIEDQMTPEEFMEACDISIAKLSKALASKLPRGEKKDARPKLELALMKAGLIPEDEDVQKTPYLKKTG